ncbi:hypothetical protein HNQ71_007058 [Mesorhizobium sangaii]|uniref:Uncharacterized protein n=1 Tax=Mesorhizobium sangaii TaxID=505389 RepID=A0A841PNW4_9HYPH|nr:hypothetical protein [Mesorhizobium sangaii]
MMPSASASSMAPLHTKEIGKPSLRRVATRPFQTIVATTSSVRSNLLGLVTAGPPYDDVRLEFVELPERAIDVQRVDLLWVDAVRN